MTTELLSTARPSRLRVLGFLAIVGGAALVGIGATQRWASIGFVSDRERAADVTVHGTDLWEGKALLLAAAVGLVLMIVMRIAASPTTRGAVATTVLVLGIAAAALGVATVLRAEDRFSGTEGIDRIATAIARETGDAEEVVREALLRTLRNELRVDVAAAIWLVVGGGLLLAAGGALSLAWVRERERTRAGSDPDAVRLREPP